MYFIAALHRMLFGTRFLYACVCLTYFSRIHFMHKYIHICIHTCIHTLPYIFCHTSFAIHGCLYTNMHACVKCIHKYIQTERTGSRPTFFNSTHLPQTLILNQIKLIFVPPHFALAPLKQRLKNRIVTLVCHCLPGLVPACLDMLCRPTLSAQGFRSLRSVVQGLLYPPPACNSTTSSRHSCAFLMVVPLGAPLTSDNPLSGEYSYLILKWFIWTRWI